MKDSNYGRWMEDKLAEMRGIVRDYVRMRNIKRASVLEFGQLIMPPAGQSSYLQEEEIWGEDPVHYRAKGYSLAAAGLETLVYEKRGEEKETEASGGQGPSKKQQFEPFENSPTWVKGSASEAVRSNTEAIPLLRSTNQWRGQHQGAVYERRSAERGHGSSYGRGSDRGRGFDRGRGADREHGRDPYRGGRGWPSGVRYYAKKW
jgi:hypothetical protein